MKTILIIIGAMIAIVLAGILLPLLVTAFLVWIFYSPDSIGLTIAIIVVGILSQIGWMMHLFGDEIESIGSGTRGGYYDDYDGEGSHERNINWPVLLGAFYIGSKMKDDGDKER